MWKNKVSEEVATVLRDIIILRFLKIPKFILNIQVQSLQHS